MTVQHKTIRQLYQMYINGDVLDDSELNDLHQHMEKVAVLTGALGDRFAMAFDESWHCARRTHDMILNREKNAVLAGLEDI